MRLVGPLPFWPWPYNSLGGHVEAKDAPAGTETDGFGCPLDKITICQLGHVCDARPSLFGIELPFDPTQFCRRKNVIGVRCLARVGTADKLPAVYAAFLLGGELATVELAAQALRDGKALTDQG